jgi:hypothetical protein
MTTETLEIEDLAFEIRRSDRRKTMGLTVDRGGELVVHVPGTTDIGDVRAWLNGKLLWIYRKLALKHEASPKVQAPEFVTGESFPYLGRRYRLVTRITQDFPLRFDGTRFTLRRDARPAEPLFRRWYIDTGGQWLAKRVESLSSRAGAKPNRVEVRDLGYRWGSCSKGGILFFDWKLLQLPVRLIDYVILHELVHLRLPHHQPSFWRALERAMPDCHERKQTLLDNAKEYLVFGTRVSDDSVVVTMK